jgi:hypothetical protein
MNDSISYVMTLRVNNIIECPQSARVEGHLLFLGFNGDLEAVIKLEEKTTHTTFELVSLSNMDSVDLVIWGPYSTTINHIIGETVGVVRSEDYAIGIQSLNIKTLGGYPWNESDRMPAIDIFEQSDPNDLFAEAPAVLYRVEAAKPISGGSSLQAYCRNRNKERVIQDFNHEKILAPAYEDGGVIGSKIALFGVQVEQALETLGKIEIEEGLPHPMMDGQWIKTCPEAASAYLITSFTEDDVEKAIALTKKAGLKYLYHYGKTFENWGHFNLYKGEFPNGVEGFRKCVEKAEAKGVKMGTHVLSNFITTNDPYVSPVPDPRLAEVGNSLLVGDIDASQTEILIQSPDYFNQYKNNTLKTVVIGEELIRYEKVSEQEPWTLLNCQRGAFNTHAARHQSGDRIAKLLDHGYKVFLTNADLTIEMSERLADLYNKTGLRQISFDGLEGNRSTGLGTYGESLMPYVWYNNLTEDLKKHLIIDASRTTHFFWHIYTRMNWGEPWYGGFRESQTEYRFKNQKYFRRNYMPGMLGWFKMTPETSIEDIEWLCAKSGGYDAGYAFVADFDAVDNNGIADDILEKIGTWEKLRIGGHFTEEQKESMRDVNKEFTLHKVEGKAYELHQVYSGKYNHLKKVRQPGEPLHSTFDFKHISDEQPMYLMLSAIDGDISNIAMEVDNYKTINLPFTLKKDQIFKYAGGEVGLIYDKNWQVVKEVRIDSSTFLLNRGSHTMDFNCEFMSTEASAHVKVEIRSIGPGELIVYN